MLNINDKDCSNVIEEYLGNTDNLYITDKIENGNGDNIITGKLLFLSHEKYRKIPDWVENFDNKTILQLPIRIEELQKYINKEPSVTLNATKFYPNKRIIKHNDNEIQLTEKENDLLQYFLKNSPASREEILQNVWKYQSNIDTHTIEAHIYRLKLKLQEANTKTSIINKNGKYELIR